jgi:hypothetical protein
MKVVLAKESNTSFVLVDDGMPYQMGYQILSRNLKQVNRKYEIELLDCIEKSTKITETDKTRL